MEDAATINDVDGSNTIWEYALGLGILFIGRCPSNSMEMVDFDIAGGGHLDIIAEHDDRALKMPG